jgi:dTDP-4-dehydrorhamnose reductase
MLGTDMCMEMTRRGHEVIAARRSDLDITSTQSCNTFIKLHQPDTVINCAAWTNVDGAESEKDAAFKNNALGAWNLAAACAESKIWLVQISTDFVFDGTKRTPYTEFDPIHPLSTYGKSKEAGEQFVRTILPDRHLICRVSFLFGQHGKNIAATILHAAQTRPELQFVDDQMVSPTYTVDAAKMIAELLKDPLPGTYHVCNAYPCSPFEFAETVLQKANLRTPVVPITFADFIAKHQPAAERPIYSVMERTCLRMRSMDTMRGWRGAVGDYVKHYLKR